MTRAHARYRRSILLGVLALSSLVWVAVDQFNLPREDMVWLMVYTLVGVLGIIVMAAVAVGVGLGVRRLLGKKRP